MDFKNINLAKLKLAAPGRMEPQELNTADLTWRYKQKEEQKRLMEVARLLAEVFVETIPDRLWTAMQAGSEEVVLLHMACSAKGAWKMHRNYGIPELGEGQGTEYLVERLKQGVSEITIDGEKGLFEIYTVPWDRENQRVKWERPACDSSWLLVVSPKGGARSLQQNYPSSAAKSSCP